MKRIFCIFLKSAICFGIFGALFFSSCEQLSTTHFSDASNPESCQMHYLQEPNIEINDIKTMALTNIQMLLVVLTVWTFVQLIKLPIVPRIIGRIRFKQLSEQAWIWKLAFPFSLRSGHPPYFAPQRDA